VDLIALKDVLERDGEPGFRERQIWLWSARGAVAYDEMTNVPAPPRSLSLALYGVF